MKTSNKIALALGAVAAFLFAKKKQVVSGIGNIDDAQYSILEDAAKKYNAEIVETTSDRGGYPRGLGYALTGFETFEQAEQAAKELHGEVVRLMTKNGWHFYYNTGWIYEPLNSILEDIYYDDPEFVAWHYPEYCTKSGELRKKIPDIMSFYYDTTTWEVGVVTDFSYLNEN